jgi:hypothetical protein
MIFRLLGSNPADYPILVHYFPLRNTTSQPPFRNDRLAGRGSKGFPEHQGMCSRLFALVDPLVLPKTTGTADFFKNSETISFIFK